MEGLLLKLSNGGGGGWPNRHITSILTRKLNLQYIFAIFTVYVGLVGEGIG